MGSTKFPPRGGGHHGLHLRGGLWGRGCATVVLLPRRLLRGWGGARDCAEPLWHFNWGWAESGPPADNWVPPTLFRTRAPRSGSMADFPFPATGRGGSPPPPASGPRKGPFGRQSTIPLKNGPKAAWGRYAGFLRYDASTKTGPQRSSYPLPRPPWAPAYRTGGGR